MPVTTAVASCYYIGWLGRQVLAPTLGVLTMLKFYTWSRAGGHVLVIPFANKKSVAVSKKVFKTEHGAMKLGARVNERCTHPITGALWYRDIPWTTTDAKTGVKTTHFIREEVDSL